MENTHPNQGPMPSPFTGILKGTYCRCCAVFASFGSLYAAIHLKPDCLLITSIPFLIPMAAGMCIFICTLLY